MPNPSNDNFRFRFGGINLTSVPDSIPPEKFASALNVRAYSPTSIRTRPGYSLFFHCGNNTAITDIQSYAAIQTDNLPRFLARDANGNIWLDGANNNGVNVGNLASPQGAGVSMLPWRPSQSPQSWMYVSSQNDYQKFSAPDSNNSVTQYKVGIAEPQNQVEAAPIAPAFTNFSGNAANWTPSGTAGNTSDSNFFTDTAGNCLADPVIATRFSVGVTIPYYLVGSLVVANNANTLAVQDVIPPIANCNITAIRYQAGNNGNCTIVAGPLPIGEGPTIPGILGSLRRGALVRLGGNETVFVRSATAGPSGQVQFVTSTNNTHAAAEAVAGIRAIVVDGNISAGQSITQPAIDSTLAAGNATLTQTFSANPFATQLGSSGIFPAQDDYIRVGILVNNIAQFTQLIISFACGAYASFTYTQNSIQNLSAGELAEISFPISALVPSGTDASLANCTAVAITIVTSGSQAFALSGFCVSGGGLPDIGDTGAPYSYRIIPRSTVTGAQGNPSPAMRYGVSPRRQNVLVPLPTVAAALPANDPQVDIWDIYRVGGTVTSFRYIGSGAPNTNFTDQYFDDTASAGQVLPVQNYEPWPSVDVPFKVTSGGGTTITVTGSQIVIAGYSAWPATIARWLPGTLINLGGQTAYTLRKRPTLISSTSYLFEIEESAGSLTPSLFTINEPNVARQFAPYVWGPDANGYFFAVGDNLRPGVIYFATPNAPDITASTDTNEPSTPSEVLLNGAIIDGLSFVASSDRWWAMYPAFNLSGGTPAAVFTPFQKNVGRGLAAPWGIASDKVNIYFWAKDGICATSGAGFTSLTDVDLYTLFPHDDITTQAANIIRNNITYYAPDYSRTATFRLTHINGYLYADYQDSTGTPRTLVCFLKTVAWSQDAYHNSIIARCAMVQPAGTITGNSPLSYGLSVMADNAGNVFRPGNLIGDNGVGINVVVGTFEYDGGDVRANEYWGDLYLDCIPSVAVQAAPTTQNVALAPATIIPASTSRQFTPISTSATPGSGLYATFLGMQLFWTDFGGDAQTSPVILYAWQPFLYDQVDITADRPDDWSNCGTPQNKWIQGFILDADTYDQTKLIQFQDDATLAMHVPQPSPIIHNGRQTIPYSFATPFLAHMVKLIPQDQVQWRKFGIQYVFEPTPESVDTWKTQNTAHGMKGYQHIGRIEGAYASAAAVTLSVIAFDGTSPATFTLPATGGAYQRILLTPTFNKGQLFGYSATSTAPFQIYENDMIIHVKEWGSKGPYTRYRLLGGVFGDQAKI